MAAHSLSSGCESVSERWRGGAGGSPRLGSAHTDACTPVGAGGRRDRLSTMGKRRCDCAGGRAQAASVSASDGVAGQAGCRLPRFGILAVQHAPVACTHECNSHLSTLLRTETVRDSSRSKDCFHRQFGGLTLECRARATRRHGASAHTHSLRHWHLIGHVHLVQQISTLGIEGPADRWSGDSGHGRRHNK